MKKETVLIVHNLYKIPGGEDSVVENEKKLLIKNGHKVFTYIRNNSEIDSFNLFQKLMLPFTSFFSLKSYREIVKIIKKENIDIVHIHNTLALISPSVYYAAKRCNVKIIQTLHNFRLLCPNALFVRNKKVCEECLNKGLICSVKNKCYRNSYIQSFINTFNIKLHRIIKTYNLVDRYIVLTEFSKKKFKSVIDEKKLYIKPNFIEENKYICKNNKEYFLYVGRLDEIKGIDILLNAWSKVNGEKLIIIGSGPEEEKIKKFICENKKVNIEYLGFKKKSEVIGLMANAKALIIPSQCYENFPMTIVESFSLGLPVIGGRFGNVGMIIKEMKNGLLFKYNDSNDLAKVINNISLNNELLDNLSKGAKLDFDTNYNANINYEILKNIYKLGDNDGEM
ncbi:glycosyltransferase family 4 protein [Clostridium perfringens]|uniref:glycosyltransferase family 4 protein n=1 Tax=Clostridium perfringens TaxID=1502 RepID=UPI001FAF2523|nr:glycosyltransferase family 4 protein [Clostridium perfringens]MDJ8959100.1 glycosyltransferase family 4 protein [Clostridium perfringens]MDT7913803.1 glycosyltransferase family 4 protein [Clostridium perfringens]MDT7926960.1 glycosyltransferase family 4 protein [Clostridium perfringens]MDT7959348.1 glycosyltransferase family 4 protein [Clostridium perfringens]MDT7975695.1 glycosyltransferase family 4 protein [Clostridium perfringens]